LGRWRGRESVAHQVGRRQEGVIGGPWVLPESARTQQGVGNLQKTTRERDY